MRSTPTSTGFAPCLPKPIPPLSLPVPHSPILSPYTLNPSQSPTPKVSPQVLTPITTQPITTPNPSSLTVTTTQVRRQLERRNQWKAVGPDGIGHWMLRTCDIRFGCSSLQPEPLPGEGATGLEDLLPASSRQEVNLNSAVTFIEHPSPLM